MVLIIDFGKCVTIIFFIVKIFGELVLA